MNKNYEAVHLVQKKDGTWSIYSDSGKLLLKGFPTENAALAEASRRGWILAMG